MKLSALFERCLNVPYIRIEGDIDFATERLGSVLQIYFEASDGATDWENNLDFPAKPYGRMNDAVWFAHRGFLKVWKGVEDRIAAEIKDPKIRKIITVGYSHGAALAVLCHEYIWFHRPDLRAHIEGYGFGCPRVVWGILPPKVKERWERFTVIRNLDDIVTHLPPFALGYTHIGTLLKIGEKEQYSPIDAHRPENILYELQRRERETDSSNLPCIR